MDPLFSMEPISNCVVAFSLMPTEIAKKVDHKAPSIEKRINTISELASMGWKIGLRFDPLIHGENWKILYSNLFENVFKIMKEAAKQFIEKGFKIESVDLGGGMGITYTDKNKKLNYKKYNTAILKFLRKHKVKIIFEPGRSIIGDTGTLVTKIILLCMVHFIKPYQLQNLTKHLKNHMNL